MRNKAFHKFKVSDGFTSTGEGLLKEIRDLLDRHEAFDVQALVQNAGWRFMVSRLVECEEGEFEAHSAGAGGAYPGLRAEDAVATASKLINESRFLPEIWIVPEDKQGFHWQVSWHALADDRRGVLGEFGDGTAPHE